MCYCGCCIHGDRDSLPTLCSRSFKPSEPQVPPHGRPAAPHSLRPGIQRDGSLVGVRPPLRPRCALSSRLTSAALGVCCIVLVCSPADGHSFPQGKSMCDGAQPRPGSRAGGCVVSSTSLGLYPSGRLGLADRGSLEASQWTFVRGSGSRSGVAAPARGGLILSGGIVGGDSYGEDATGAYWVEPGGPSAQQPGTS